MLIRLITVQTEMYFPKTNIMLFVQAENSGKYFGDFQRKTLIGAPCPADDGISLRSSDRIKTTRHNEFYFRVKPYEKCCQRTEPLTNTHNSVSY